MLSNSLKNIAVNLFKRASLTFLILLIFCILPLGLFGQSQSVERKSAQPSSTERKLIDRETTGRKSSRPAPSGHESLNSDSFERDLLKSDSSEHESLKTDSSELASTEDSSFDDAVSGITRFLFWFIPIIFIGIVFLFIIRRRKNRYDNTGNMLKGKPEEKVSSKLIVIKNIELDYLKGTIQKFCELHNKGEYTALPRLILLPDQFVIIFPFDIRFKIFCNFIYHLKNTEGSSEVYNPFVRAWCITNVGDEWMSGEIVNKKVMLYVPDNGERDKIYLTTEDNLGFRFGFLIDSREKLNAPVINYEPMSLNLQDYRSSEVIDFE